MKAACHFKENNWYYLLPMIKFQAFRWKLDVGKLACAPTRWRAFQYVNTSRIWLEMISRNAIFDSVSWGVATFGRAASYHEPVLPSGQCTVLQSDAWREGPSKVQDRKISFTITETDKFTDITPYSTLQLTFEDTAPLELWYGTQAEGPQLSEKTIRVILLLQPPFCEARCFSYTSAKHIPSHKELGKKKVAVF